MKIVFYGLTITSSWGNGHATTYRSLLNALARRGHTIVFIEKDAEWYRSNRDLFDTSFCGLHLYESWESSRDVLQHLGNDADVIVVGSFFPDAIALTRELLDEARCPLLFYDIDTPVTLSRLRSAGRTEYLDSAMIPHYDAYLSFSAGRALRELEDDFGSRNAVPFFCSVDPELYKPVPVRDEFQCDLSYLGTYAADRQPKLMGLLDQAAGHLKDSNFLVAGPQYPEEISWKPNVARINHVPPPDHPAFYSSARYTLNLTRRDMVDMGYSPSVRLFEASACGAAILSDAWAGLEEFLTPGEEVLVPADASEVVRIVSSLSDEERLRMGRRARERILGEHTSEHRAIQFEKIVSGCRSRRDDAGPPFSVPEAHPGSR